MATSIDPNTIVQSIELLKQAKPLFESDNQFLLAGVGALGAIGGALAAFFPTFWHTKFQQRQLRHSVAAQLYAEIKATLQVERHRGYIQDIRNIVAKFDQGEITSQSYQVQIANDRFPIFRANIPHLALLESQLQTKIVLFYQLLEAAVQDIKPGGLLNTSEVDRKPYSELLEILLTARSLGDEILAQIESSYPGIA